jgi:hypothetical protein
MWMLRNKKMILACPRNVVSNANVNHKLLVVNIHVNDCFSQINIRYETHL